MHVLVSSTKCLDLLSLEAVQESAFYKHPLEFGCSWPVDHTFKNPVCLTEFSQFKEIIFINLDLYKHNFFLTNHQWVPLVYF